MMYLLIAIIAALAVLFAVCFVRAVRIKGEHHDILQADPEKAGVSPEKCAADLSEMIKIPTVSLIGVKDNTQIYKMHRRLEELFPLIHKSLEKTDIDGALLFRWKGKNSSLNPILLMSHMDVVEALGSWKYPAFSGTVADGKIYGRGAIDTKGALCAILEGVEYLLAEGFVPERDIYIASSNNEEITGDGAVKTVEYLYEKGIRLDLVMDEGGAVMTGGANMMDCGCAMVGIFEKGRANIRFTARSHGGHASVPFKDSPFSRLSRLIYRLETKSPFKKKLTKPVREMFHAMAPHMAFKYRFLYANTWLFGPLLAKIMGKMGGKPNALVSTTCVFTMASGSHGANIIPQEASVTANFRFMIHENLTESFKKIGKAAKKLRLEVEMLAGYDCCKPADKNCYAYNYVNSSIRKNFGEIPVIPYVMLAGTDARHYTKICDCVLRFVPIIMTNEQFASAHAIDENISVSSLARAAAFYKDFIKNYDKGEA